MLNKSEKVDARKLQYTCMMLKHSDNDIHTLNLSWGNTQYTSLNHENHI